MWKIFFKQEFLRMNSQNISFSDLLPIIQEKIQKGESFSFLANGDSMLPFLRNGQDLVTLSPKPERFKKNDVIFYRRENGQFILHRIVKILDSGEMWLCGDNQLYIERKIFPEDVIAILTEIKRDGKMLSLTSLSYKCYLLRLAISRNTRLFYHRAKNKLGRILKRK